MLAVLPDATGLLRRGRHRRFPGGRQRQQLHGAQVEPFFYGSGVKMTETELKEIEARLPKGAERVGAHLDASHLAAEVRNAWGEGVQLRQGLMDVRNTGVQADQQREAAGALAERYRVERDELVARRALLRKSLAELVNALQSGPLDEVAMAEALTKARRALDEAP